MRIRWMKKILLLFFRTKIHQRKNPKDFSGNMVFYLAQQIFNGGAGSDFVFDNPDFSKAALRYGQGMIRTVGVCFLKKDTRRAGAAG